MPQRTFVVDLLFLIFLTILARVFAFFPFDLSVTQALQQINNPGFDALMKFLSAIGEQKIFIPLGLVVSFVVWLYKRREGLLVFDSFVGLGIIGWFLKLLINRPRPNPSLIHQFVPYLSKDSYPSGHVLLYLGLFGALLYVIGREVKESSLKRITQFALWSLIILIGISRIYLGEHWLSDVLGSYLLGIAWLYILIRIYNL